MGAGQGEEGELGVAPVLPQLTLRAQTVSATKENPHRGSLASTGRSKWLLTTRGHLTHIWAGVRFQPKKKKPGRWSWAAIVIQHQPRQNVPLLRDSFPTHLSPALPSLWLTVKLEFCQPVLPLGLCRMAAQRLGLAKTWTKS